MTNGARQEPRRPERPLEIIAFKLHEQQFCLPTTSIREIRGWAPATPVPHSPADVMGVMNLRGSVIPIIDLAIRLGLRKTEPMEHSAIVVAEVDASPFGLVVDTVSDILTVQPHDVQPVPDMGMTGGAGYSDGIVAASSGMICLLNLERLFEGASARSAA